MAPLFSTIVNGTVQNCEAAILLAAAALPIAWGHKKRRYVPLDGHTKQDIGVEPGSITWL